MIGTTKGLIPAELAKKKITQNAGYRIEQKIILATMRGI